MSVSIAIQAHPLRTEMAEKLAVVCLEGAAEIVYDPDPAGDRNPWRTYREALVRGLDAPRGTTHRLIVQDDVYVCDHFVEGVAFAAASQPSRVLAFFVAGTPLQHTRRVQHAFGEAYPWAELENSTWVPVVATAWPIDVVEDLVDWVDRRFADRRFPPQFTADDEICGRWLRDVGMNPLASVPSLVEHPDSVYSIASSGRRGQHGLDATRRAYIFAEDIDGYDPRAQDWLRGPAPIF